MPGPHPFACCRVAFGPGCVFLYGTAADCARVTATLGPDAVLGTESLPTLLDAWTHAWLAMEASLVRAPGARAALVHAPDWWQERAAPRWSTHPAPR